MEHTLTALGAEETFSACEKLWKTPDARRLVSQMFDKAWTEFRHRVMMLDDDPTGVQTVHDIHVATTWDEAALQREMADERRLFFVLTNSRSFSSEKTAEVHREIALNAVKAAKGQPLMIISRGDSTLRGHYPLETRILRETLEEAGEGPFSGEVLCPFFREGGRFTLNGVHYVQEGGMLTPAAQTEFARDKTFGYGHSHLAEYIEEKSQGEILAGDVIVITLGEIRSLDVDAIVRRLEEAEGFRYIVSDALEEADVQVLAVALMRLMARGRRYLIRSAAAVPKVFGNVSSRPLLSRKEMVEADSASGGLVLVGSHVKKTTDQLNCLRESDKDLEWIEFSVARWAEEGGLAAETRRVVARAEDAMRTGRTAVVYTSRQLVAPEGATAEALLAISVRISGALTDVVGTLSLRPRFLIAKGGITSSDVGTRALRVKRALVLGQAQPGIPVWQTGEESLFPGLSYIIFPGNVGGVNTLRAIVEALA
ncbi:MAG: hydroxyacid dehydrogenase [Clostridia bacterium]|nr:hydroxyacid dehydrogenase [Clostridia bacterium]